ncbi:hypothetical protein D3C78_1073930 [compost metagenome]
MTKTFLLLHIGYLELAAFNRLQNILYLFFVAKLKLLALELVELRFKTSVPNLQSSSNAPVFFWDKGRDFILTVLNDLYSYRLNAPS